MKNKINFFRILFLISYNYQPLRGLEEITKDLLEVEKQSEGLLMEIIGG